LRGSKKGAENMFGTAKKMIDKIIAESAKGDKNVEDHIRVKLILDGIMVDKLDFDTPDNEVVINKIKKMAAAYGVSV
jgi:hypothetical protein